MATSWSQLGPAVRTRLVSQLTGGSPPPVYLDMAPLDAALPYVIVNVVAQTEEQVFDDSAEPTEIDFDISVYSPKIGTTARTTHLNHVSQVANAIRRWTPTLANWTAHPIRSDDQTPMTILEDAIQTVCSFTVMTERQ